MFLKTTKPNDNFAIKPVHFTKQRNSQIPLKSIGLIRNLYRIHTGTGTDPQHTPAPVVDAGIIMIAKQLYVW